MTMVAVLALDGVVGFDLAVPGEVFGMANSVLGTRHYDIRVCAPRRTVTTDSRSGGYAVRAPWGLAAVRDADIVAVPGTAAFLSAVPAAVRDAILAAASKGARIASVCTGAFTVAATGLLDGRRATTHWMFAPDLARRHPRIEVDASVLYVDSGQILTSAGVASGLDLCLHLVRSELGAETAAATARRIVMAPQRDGGQAQFIEHRTPSSDGAGLHWTLEWLERNLHHPLTLDDIAGHAAISVRSLNRHFRAQIGTTPMQWLLRARVNRARQLLETTPMAVDRVAAESGFGSPEALRYHFGRLIGTTPHAYRAAFGGA